MINRLLVANRGEIALRIIRTCREMGVETVAIYGPEDAGAPHARLADRAVEVAAKDFLDSDTLLDVARDYGADALHPGYGFLSESPALARRCEERNVRFVGPSSAAIAVMADKTKARSVADSAGVPTLPSLRPSDDLAAIERFGAEVGWPLIVKAATGGGGRATKVISSVTDAKAAIAETSNQAAKLFASPDVFIEKYLTDARHIEVQVLADQHGTTASLGTRDCSVQRRRQKLVEEAPAGGLSADVAARLERAAVALAQEVAYENAGTVEFLVAGDAFYFLEMNTRIQVEHPVTEQVFGVDLVRTQLEIASGVALAPDVTETRPNGYAVELRVNAEDPRRGFLPALGTITTLQFPDTAGIRVDAGYDTGQSVTSSYDGLIAKLIAWAPTRHEAVDRLAQAIDASRIDGVGTTLELGAAICADADFRAGSVSTDWLEETMTPRFLRDPVYDGEHGVEIGGRFHRLPMTAASRRANRSTSVRRASRAGASAATSDGAELVRQVRSPMQGSVTAICAEPGQLLRRGETLCVIEAMKLENHVTAAFDGVVDEIFVGIGDQVHADQVIARLRRPEDPEPEQDAANQADSRSTR